MRLRIFSASSGGECQLRRENNQYNLYKKIQRFAGTCVEPNSLLRRENNQYNIYKKKQRFARTKTLRVKQAFCKGNNKYNSFAWTVIS